MLEEAPATLLKQAKDSFEIDPDVQIVRRIEEASSRIEQKKLNTLESITSKISQLEREKQTLLDQISSLTTSNKSSLEILNNIGDKQIKFNAAGECDKNLFELFQMKSEEMDSLKVHFAKEMNSLESQINSMNILIIKLNEQLDNLVNENEHIVSDNILNNPDSKIMKINLYKSLGVLIETVKTDGYNDTTNDSKFDNPNTINSKINRHNKNDLNYSHDKILIYNQEKSVTSVLDATEKYSDYFITNHIWENL